jgi:hypothetical protein
MKTFLKAFAILFVVSCFVSCKGDEEGFEPATLEVTPNNISGYWMLSEYNGMEIPEGTFCYVQYIRKDRKFVMYQKFDSMYPRRITGVFAIENDIRKGYVLSGKYDYGMGEWNNDYIVSALYADSMVLVADSENGGVCKYLRCNELPADVLEEAK